MTFASGVSGNAPIGANFGASPAWSISTSSAAVSGTSLSSSANKRDGSCVRPRSLAFIFSPHSSPESAQEECFHGLARSQNPADLYIAYALLKFFDFFFLPYDQRIKRIRDAYLNEGRTLRVFDDVVLVLMAVFVVLLFSFGVEYLSFTTGLLVG